jgi:hypothetical protein
VTRRQPSPDGHPASELLLPEKASSAAACVRDEASDNQHDANEEPRKWIQMLVTAGRGCSVPAGRPWPIALNPCHIEGEQAGTGEQAKP